MDHDALLRSDISRRMESSLESKKRKSENWTASIPRSGRSGMIMVWILMISFGRTDFVFLSTMKVESEPIQEDFHLQHGKMASFQLSLGFVGLNLCQLVGNALQVAAALSEAGDDSRAKAVGDAQLWVFKSVVGDTDH